MGRGNFCPCGQMTDQWYVDYMQYVEENDPNGNIISDAVEMDIDMVLEAIQQKYPSFEECDEWVDTYWDQRNILKNKFFCIGVADNQWSLAFYIMERSDLESEQYGLARRHYQDYRDGIRKILLDNLGTIHLRNGAWMSTEWTREMERMRGVV